MIDGSTLASHKLNSSCSALLRSAFFISDVPQTNGAEILVTAFRLHCLSCYLVLFEESRLKIPLIFERCESAASDIIIISLFISEALQRDLHDVMLIMQQG